MCEVRADETSFEQRCDVISEWNAVCLAEYGLVFIVYHAHVINSDIVKKKLGACSGIYSSSATFNDFCSNLPTMIVSFISTQGFPFLKYFTRVYKAI